MHGGDERSFANTSPGPVVAQGPASSAAVSSGSGFTAALDQLSRADGSAHFVISGLASKKSRDHAPARGEGGCRSGRPPQKQGNA